MKAKNSHGYCNIHGYAIILRILDITAAGLLYHKIPKISL